MTRPYHPYHPYRSYRPRHPYRPRHRGAHGRPGWLPAPSDALFAVLALLVLLTAAFVVGGLMAHPFG